MMSMMMMQLGWRRWCPHGIVMLNVLETSRPNTSSRTTIHRIASRGHAHDFHHVLLTLELRFNLRHIAFEQGRTLFVLHGGMLVGGLRMLHRLQFTLAIFDNLT